MRAVVQDGYGSPDRVLSLEEVPVPPVGPHDVLIRTRATSVNTPDWATVIGVPTILRLGIGLRRPKQPVRGSDLAGVVQTVGSRVSEFKPGDEVVGVARSGTFAEYAVAPAGQLVAKPEAIDFPEAAGAVITGLAALTAIRDLGHAKAGARVLINGASGGVGTMAVQLAKHLGAEVTGVCGPGHVELVTSLGADHVIDYTRQDFSSESRRYDVVLDNVLNHPPKAVAAVLAPGGVLIPNSIGYTGRLLAGLPRTARAVMMGLGRTTVRLASPAVNQESLGVLMALLESGAIRVIVDAGYPLDHAAEAVAQMLRHHASGKIVITG